MPLRGLMPAWAAVWQAMLATLVAVCTPAAGAEPPVAEGRPHHSLVVTLDSGSGLLKARDRVSFPGRARWEFRLSRALICEAASKFDPG